MKIALIDGDLIAYPSAASVKEHEPVDLAIHRADETVRTILDMTGATSYRMWIGGNDNFRKIINPQYKANRKDVTKPVFLQDVEQFLIDEWNCEVAMGCETDDMLGVNQKDDTILCSFDKDLLTIPGMHFNWKKQIFTEVEELDGLKQFYKQMLAGDKSDNVFGFDGLARATMPKFIEKIIDPLETEQEMFDVVYDMYANPVNFVLNTNCLWILHNMGELWANRQNLTLPSECKQEVEAQLKYMKSLNLTILTEHITTKME